MRKYLFLDSWVFSLLSRSLMHERLLEHIRLNQYTAILTSSLLSELYNPIISNDKKADRVENAINLLGSVPCVIVNPSEVYRAEIDNDLKPLSDLPYKFDLNEMGSADRPKILRALLRRDPLFIKQGIDIREWAENLRVLKRNWLREVEEIINNACVSGYLTRDNDGEATIPSTGSEFFCTLWIYGFLLLNGSKIYY